tara:strand:- start:42313 stop:42636 length:324 start_codon:yes stop_codon:yes gene_type:complete
MDSCKNCGTKFKFFPVLKSFIRNYKNVSCRDCGAVHQHKLINRIFGAIFIAVALAVANPLPVFRDFNFIDALKCILIFAGAYLWLAALGAVWSRLKLVEETRVSPKA